MEMKQLIGKLCKLTVNIKGRDLFYNATITDVTQTHLSFIDRYGAFYSYRLLDVVEVQLNDNEKGGEK